MKIVLDRRSCNCWQPACDSHFAWHFLRDEITPVDCTVEVSDDGSRDITFYVFDRDGIDKVLVVDDANRGEVSDSWMAAWEKQQAAKA